MGRHRRSFGRLGALILAAAGAAADAQWTSWDRPTTAVQEFTDAVRERAEATYYATLTNTSTCWDGDHEVTARAYEAGAYGEAGLYFDLGWTNNLEAPIVLRHSVRELNSTNLLPAGFQTNTWTNAAGQVTTTNIPLFRFDDLHTWTNCDGTVTSNSTTRIAYSTNNPGRAASLAWIAHVDQALDQMMPEPDSYAVRPFVDHTVDLDAWFSTPIATNYDWAAGDPGGPWVLHASHPYDYPQDFPRLTRSNVWDMAGIGRRVELVDVYDRGATYPRWQTNTAVLYGWQVGDLNSYTVHVTTVTFLERYATNRTIRHRYTYDNEGDPTNMVLAQAATYQGASGIYLAKGFGGAGVAGRYEWAADGYQQVGGPHFISLYSPGRAAIWDHPVAWASSATGALYYQTRIPEGPSYNTVVGCYAAEGGPVVGEVAPHPAWRFTDRFTMTASGGQIESYFEQPISNALLDVFSATTNENFCLQVPEPAALPDQLQITVRGRYWKMIQPNGGNQLVTTQQTVAVAAPGTYALDYPFVDILALTNSAGAYYPKDGVHVRVRWGDARAAYYTRFPDYALRVAFEERKKVLNLLRWTGRVCATDGDPAPWYTWTDRLTADEETWAITPLEYYEDLTGELRKWDFNFGP